MHSSFFSTGAGFFLAAVCENTIGVLLFRLIVLDIVGVAAGASVSEWILLLLEFLDRKPLLLEFLVREARKSAAEVLFRLMLLETEEGVGV